MTTARRIDRIWLGLLAATAVTWSLGEAGLASAGAAWPIVIVLVLSLIKGLAIALDFMELRGAPAPWRLFVVGWLVVVVLVILAVAAWPRP